ncbi:hypothetical protein ACOME3_008018 [Neoechinorhynchus agilis]
MTQDPRLPYGTFSALVRNAIEDSIFNQCCIHEIYDYVSQNYPDLTRRRPMWRSSIRRCLFTGNQFELIDYPMISDCQVFRINRTFRGRTSRLRSYACPRNPLPREPFQRNNTRNVRRNGVGAPPVQSRLVFGDTIRRRTQVVHGPTGNRSFPSQGATDLQFENTEYRSEFVRESYTQITHLSTHQNQPPRESNNFHHGLSPTVDDHLAWISNRASNSHFGLETHIQQHSTWRTEHENVRAPFQRSNDAQMNQGQINQNDLNLFRQRPNALNSRTISKGAIALDVQHRP